MRERIERQPPIMAWSRIVPGPEGKKTYEITDAGRTHLAENRDMVDSIFDRVSKLMGHFLDEPMTEVHKAFKEVAKATYSRASDAVQTPETLKQIVEILGRASREIEAIGK